MKIIVKAKTRAKEAKIERVDQPTLGLEVSRTKMITYRVSVREAPVNGQANEAIIKALAKYFNIATTNISLITGQTSKQKVFEIR